MMNFKQNQHKLCNNHVQFSNQNLLCKFVNLNLLAGNPGSAPATTIYFIILTWASPYGTHMEPSCTAHIDPIWVPIWDPYRLLAGQWLMVGSVLHHILGCEACELHICTIWLYYKPHFIYPKLTVSHKGASVFFIVMLKHFLEFPQTTVVVIWLNCMQLS